LKRKSVKEPTNMSPRELARYAVVHLSDYAHKYNCSGNQKLIEELKDSEYSIYNTYIQKLDKDEYIEYLEQVVKEIDHWRLRLQVEECISSAKWQSICDGLFAIHEKQNVEEKRRRSKELIQIYRNFKTVLDEEFTSSRYTKAATISDWVIKSTWE